MSKRPLSIVWLTKLMVLARYLDRRVTVGLKHHPTVNPGYPSSSYHVGISLLTPLFHPFHFLMVLYLAHLV